jgi:hypothetical protein
LFLNGISEGIPCRGQHKYCRFLYGPLFRVSIPPFLNMGDDLEECKINIFLSEKLWIEKIPFEQINHLSIASTSISPSNNGISKFTCTLKGVAWPLDEDASPVGIHRRICAKLSMISFLCCMRDSSRKILIRSPSPSSLFSSPMGCFRSRRNRSCNGSIGSSPNFLYLDLVGDMHEEKTMKRKSL